MRYSGNARHIPRTGFIHVRFTLGDERELLRADLPQVPDVGERITFGMGPYYVVRRQWMIDPDNRHDTADRDAAAMYCWVLVRAPEIGEPGYRGPGA